MRRFEQMADFTSKWITSNWRTSNRVLGSLVAALVLVGVAPASAAPTLFSGLLKNQGWQFSSPYTTASAPKNTLQKTTSGDFTVPAKAFTLHTAYTTAFLPQYPFIYVRITQSNFAGAFGRLGLVGRGHFGCAKFSDDFFPYFALLGHMAEVKVIEPEISGVQRFVVAGYAVAFEDATVGCCRWGCTGRGF